MKISSKKIPNLKNLLFIALGILLMPSVTIGQTEGKKNFKLGFTTSPTFGWLNVTPGGASTKSNGLRMGFSYGVLGDFGFSDNYFFSSGVNVTTVNTSAKITQPITTTSVYKIQYIELPLTLKLKSNEQNGRLYYGQFGLSTGFKIGAKQAIDNERDKDISDDINLFRLGLIIGGGSEWKIGSNLNLLTGVSYNNGFTDLFNTSEKSKNSYASLNLGVFF